MRSRVGVAVGAGAYAAGVAFLALSVVSGTADLDLPAHPLLLSVPAGMAVACAAALWVRRLEILHRDRIAARVAAVPVLGGVVAVLAALAGTPGAVGAGVLGVGGGLLGTFVLRGAALHRRARRLAGDASRIATLPDPTDRSWTRRARAVYVVLGGLWILFAVGSYAEGSGHRPVAFLLGLGFLSAGLNATRRPEVTEAGVLFESRAASRLVEWGDLAGYYLGDDLVLLRPERWRSDLVFDGEAVDREAIDAVDRYLPRSRTRTVPASGLVPAEGADSRSAGG